MTYDPTRMNPTAERRRPRPASAIALPWTIGAMLLVATLVVAAASYRNTNERHDADVAASSAVFSTSVADTESRLVLEQSKLMFLLKGVAAWAATTGDPAQTDLSAYVGSQPIEDRVPALRSVLIASRTNSAQILNATSPAGESTPELVGTNLGDLPGIVEAMDRAAASNMIRVATSSNESGDWVWLVVAVPGHDDRFVVGRFVGTVFLSPALGADGTSASLRPDSASFVVTRPGTDAPPADRASNRVVELDETKSGFTYAGEVDVFGSTWRLDLVSSPDFVRPATSNEPLLLLGAGLVLTFAVTALLLTRRRESVREAKASEALNRSSRRFTTGFENAPIGMAEVDASGRVVRANDTLKVQLGVTELIGTLLPDLLHGDDAEAHRQQRDRLERGIASSAQLDVRYIRPDGTTVWVTESMSALDRVNDSDRHFLLQQLDTTHRHDAEVDLQRMAYTDDLTGLPNRPALMAALDTSLISSEISGTPLAVLFIDLDLFKVVNDSLGHSAGDAVIRVIADRLLAIVPHAHLVARFGGDEFVVVCPGVSDPAVVSEFADSLLEAIGEPIALPDAPVQISASIGFTFSAPGDTGETVIRDADAAMYQAKTGGRNGVRRFDPPIRRAAVERLDIERGLRLGLENDEFDVYYQPVIDLDTNRVVGLEALLRWQHPERGLIEPLAFLDVANETGMLDEIDTRTLARAWRQLAEWSQRGSAAADWHLSVNCSSRWFQDGRLRTLLPEVLASADLDPSRLWLELTESDLLADSGLVHAELDALHALGVRVAIDDFGTGFSSLSYLSRFDIDRLKIDQSFIQSLGRSDADDAIVSAVVDMASALGIRTVAEGTENAAQLEAARRLGADFAQGYWLSPPLSAAEVDAALIKLS